MSRSGNYQDQHVKDAFARIKRLELAVRRRRLQFGGATTFDPSSTSTPMTSTDMQAAIEELEALILAGAGVGPHIADPTDAHDASAVSYDDSGASMGASDVQGALDVIDVRLDALEAAIVAALDDLSDVVITAPAALDRLQYDGTQWVNTAAIWRPLMDGAGNVVTDGVTGEAIMVLS